MKGDTECCSIVEAICGCGHQGAGVSRPVSNTGTTPRTKETSTAEELRTAPTRLARAIKELEDLEEEHKESRSEQAAERKKLRGTILALAGQIRSQGR